MSAWGLQFSAGDQTIESRQVFWRSDFKKCPKCQGTNITDTKHVAGCRMNGDAYGTNTFECNDCKWLTSFQWDDDGSPYWYETQGWVYKPTQQPTINHSQDR